jgi:hypothetical protein
MNKCAEPSLSEYLKKSLTDKKALLQEKRIFKTSALTFILILAMQAAYILFRQQTVPGFFMQHGMWFFYLALTVTSIGAALWHYKSYSTRIGCMLGMMIGMTFGMQTGMMLGPIIAPQAGFLAAALTAMIAGAVIGAWAGSCCGIMGTLEGLMAGIMGGPMGAMIGAMFMGNLKFFMPVYMILNLMVLIGFSYMIFQEIVFNHAKTKHNAIAPWKYVLACVVITIFLMVLIDVSSVMRANMMAMMAKQGMAMGGGM